MIPNQKVKVRWVGYTKKYYIDLGYTFTKIDDIFEVDIEHLPLKSNMYVRFICDYCKGENQIDEKSKYAKYCNLINQTKIIKKNCCSNSKCIGAKLSESKRKKQLREGETLEEKYPEIAKEWNYEKNKLTPSDYNYNSNYKKMWWKCVNGHDWDSTIRNRTMFNYKCPICSGKIVVTENCLATTHPELSGQWHPTKNGNLTPFDVVYHYSKKVWWLGNCGHEWDAPINTRTSRNLGCPYCSGSRVCIDNCLATMNPELTKEWNIKKNKDKTPYDYTQYSMEKVWWICSNCNNEWKATIRNRSKGNKCPACKETIGEKQIRKFLESNGIKLINQFSFEDLKGVGGKKLTFDFAIFQNNKLKLIIEYDGHFHFRKVYKKDNHINTVIHDKRKNTYCRNRNIPLIRIPFWEFENLEFLLYHILGYFKLLNYNDFDKLLVLNFLVNHSDWTEEKYKIEYDKNK